MLYPINLIALGLHAVEDRVHAHDFHATMLHALGLDPVELNYFRDGRRESAVIWEGSPLNFLKANRCD